MYDEHLLPPGARLLHIGPPKTGTTAIQQGFHQIRDQLEQHGVRYAGRGSRPREAVEALVSDGRRSKLAAWDRLVAEVDGYGDLRVCVSNEQFAAATPEQAARAVAELGGEGAHVVMTVRPIAALLPSQWQQRVRRRFQMIGYDDWLREVLDGQPGQRSHDHFWNLHDVSAQLDRWGAAEPGRVTVIASDERDRDYLPRVFEGLLGLPEGLLVPPADRSNRSLDHAEAELLRALDDVAAAREWPRDWYLTEVKERVSKRLRAMPRQTAYPILLPDWAADRVAELDQQRADLLAGAGFRVIGDPTQLTATSPRIRPADQPAPAVPVETAASVAATVLESALAAPGRDTTSDVPDAPIQRTGRFGRLGRRS